MSKFTQRLSIFLIVTLVLGLVLPVKASAATGKVTDLTIHKITGSEETTATYDQLVNGTAPAGSKPISNISFTYWKVTSEQLKQLKANPQNYDTLEKVRTLLSEPTGTTSKTAADGTTKVPNLAEGYYWFIEDKSTAIKDAKAVPFGLELPITNEAGTGYINDLHVFPKNTLQDLPTIDKDVKSDNTKSASFAVGESFNWIIQPSVPKGIEEYEKFEVTDTIDSRLTFQGTEKVKVTINGNVLSSGDYTATYSNNKLVVSFTKAGLGKLNVENPKLEIFVPTMINDTAVMGLPISNDATLNFDNGHGVTTQPGTDTPPPTVPPTDIPKVYTGGKKFVKTNGQGTNLGEAEFVIMNGAGDYLVQDGNLKVSWTKSENDATKFISSADGKFEVKGLAYGDDNANNTGATTYKIKEVKAPKGYSLPTNPVTEFTVNSTSYHADPSATVLADAAAQEIINKKTEIPNTGGIGTVIFTVIGIGLMALALVFFRRKQA